MNTAEKKNPRGRWNVHEGQQGAYQGTSASNTHLTAHTAPQRAPRRAHDDAANIQMLGEILADWDRAMGLLRSANPVAVHIYEAGYATGIDEGERRAAVRAQHAAHRFLDYLAEDPNTTPHPIPALQNDWRAAA